MSVAGLMEQVCNLMEQVPELDTLIQFHKVRYQAHDVRNKFFSDAVIASQVQAGTDNVLH